MKIYLTAAVAVTLTAASLSAPAKEDATPDESKSSQSCDAFAENTIGRMVDIFHNKQKTEDQKRQMLSDIFQKAVDTDWIGQFVLGRFWKNTSAEEQAEYLKNYRAYLTSVYISKFNDEAGFSVDAIKIAGLKPTQQNQYEASTLILRKGEPEVHVSYALEQFPAKCQVHDIRIEGVSLLANHRSEFSAVAGNAGVKGVIDAMKKQLSN